MVEDFSWKHNDTLALKVAEKISQRYPEDPAVDGAFMSLCEYLSDVAGVEYATTVDLLKRLQPLSNTPLDILRVSFAIMHCKAPSGGKSRSDIAHARIYKVTVSDKESRYPKLSLHMLVVSSRHAGKFVQYQLPLTEAVKLHRAVYSGRARKYGGRSLLEFVGCVVTLRIRDALVVGVSANKEERKINKQLCVDRAQADVSCHEATQCCFCKKVRSQCRLATKV